MKPLPVFLSSLLVLTAAVPVSSARPSTLNRADIPAEYKWDVSQIYPDLAAWEQAVNDTDGKIAALAGLKGTLQNGPADLLKAYQALEDIGLSLRKIGGYISFQRDADARDQAAAELGQRVGVLSAKYGTAVSWFDPELLAIPQATVEKWIETTPALAPYAFSIRRTYRLKKHSLDEATEQLLSYYSRANGAPHSIFREFSTGDIQFASVTLASGETFVLTPGNYQAALEKSRDQVERARVTELYYSAYTPWLNTYAAIYDGILQQNWARARARQHPNTLAAALAGNAIPESVVENLIATVRAGAGPLQRYVKLRQRLLGLEKSYLYDQTIPIYQSDTVWDYDTARAVIRDSVRPLGVDYQNKLAAMQASGRIDVYQNTGKRSGAYNSGIYGVGPYVLLNHNDTLDATFTLAHELGHSLHSILSDENQTFFNSRYTIFVAEVASTLNERLLLDELLARTTDPKERFLLIQHEVDNIVRTFYRQVLFAAYELEAHRRVERGEPITAPVLTGIYTNLLKDFYGDSVEIDPWQTRTWARVPHFFNTPYYVYQYATSFAASAKIYELLKNGAPAARQSALDNYLTLLKSGGNDYPVEQLKRAGVDLTQPEAIQAVIAEMDRLVSVLEAEAAKIKD